MDSCRWRGPFDAVQTAPGARGGGAWPGRVALVALVALMALAVGAVAPPGRARAASGGQQIVFTSPIYPGRNNGNAEGPVGANVSIQGSGWGTNGDPITVTLVDMQDDASAGGQQGAACASSAPKVTIPSLSSVQADSSGAFTATFQWPAGAGTKNHSYWACGAQSGATFPGVSFYTVLSSNPPSLSVNVSQAAPGSSVTVTGQNWLPGNLPIAVIIAPCVACEPNYSQTATTISQADGTLSVSMKVPAQAQIGDKLFVSGQSVDSNNAGDLSAEDPTTAPSFTVVAQPTPTPTPTNTPTPTPTRNPTAVGSGGGGNTANGASGSTLLVVLLAALGVVLLLAAIVAVLLFLRSRGPAPGAPGAGGPRSSGPGGAYPPQGGGYSPYSGPPRGGWRPPTDPNYPETSLDYYDEPPQRPRR